MWNKEKSIDQQWREGNEDSDQQFGAEGRNIQPEQSEETRIQKNEESLRNLQDIFKHSNSWIIGVPKGEEEEQESANLLLYPAKLSFRTEGQIKCFPDKIKLKEFIITQPLLYEMLKELM